MRIKNFYRYLFLGHLVYVYFYGERIKIIEREHEFDVTDSNNRQSGLHVQQQHFHNSLVPQHRSIEYYVVFPYVPEVCS